MSFLTPKKERVVDTNLHGEHRNFVMTGAFEKVLPKRKDFSLKDEEEDGHIYSFYKYLLYKNQINNSPLKQVYLSVISSYMAKKMGIFIFLTSTYFTRIKSKTLD